ncbi:MAG: glycosyltransferase family 4 protein [Chloroflexaceae bacterium]|nr:glycosyltransferase family 4 protein [Chloroflexaceae bacterium]
MSLIICLLISFWASLLAVFLIKQRWGQQLLDIPNQRSSHQQPTPRGGGLGFILPFALTSAIANLTESFSFPLLSLWLILAPLALIGILDDRQGVPARIRYLVQLTCAGMAIYWFGHFELPFLSNWGILGRIIAILLSAIGFTAYVNFYNFMDGLDGLVAGMTAVQLGFLAVYLNQPLWWLLVAALLGFLRWNWSPAQIFMGDAGSTVLGAVVAIALLRDGGNGIRAWSALAVTGPLVIDAIYTLCRRLLRGENIFQAHRTHLYQRLQVAGWSHAQVASTYIGINLLVALAIFLAGAIGAWLSVFGLILGLGLGECWFSRYSSAQSNA